MQKKILSLGLMSGTSADGVDASIIQSNGVDQYELILDKYFEYEKSTYKKIHSVKDKINKYEDLDKYQKELWNLEREITLFHAKIVNDINQKYKDFIVGFHGQTIYHNAQEKISFQLGDAKLLSQLVKKKIVYNFRKNDILNGGQGAPLTPIFHKLIVLKNKIKTPVCILNIGGISNITSIINLNNFSEIKSRDLGPGNCLIDNWVRKNSNERFDKGGNLAKTGTINQIILEQAQELYSNRLNKNKLSFDVGDFDISFARGLSLQDGVATLTEFTGELISVALFDEIKKFNIKKVLLCGGGRKNKILIEKIKNNISSNVEFESIDSFGIDGDYIESQAFAFLAIRSILNLPLSFPTTTGCNKPCVGGNVI